MPLFGHKNRDKTAGHDNAPGHDTTSGPGMTGSGGNRLHKNQGGQHDPRYPSPNAPGAGGYSDNNSGNNPRMNNEQYAQQGYGAGGTNADTHGGAARHGMAPHSDTMGDPAHPRASGGGGGGSRFAGKVESAVGSMLGSENLKRKGLEKEQESQALKLQAAELSEAERLEQDALATRQRAVAHGAHPDHKYLGSHNPGAGAANMNELGDGANTGIGGMGGAGSNARGGY
ncbi:hypothetical protein A7U60_g6613 [Sanghuangporus baumii]|uniref:Uncharacterized protein n=1 Tax=Sanghuangporus baumii TaxID=108892 RepID=A0A9Q5HUR3_SANBA|nr:hypothetical protein A7U60_g6613 [Sanghuangporus baumii]